MKNKSLYEGLMTIFIADSSNKAALQNYLRNELGLNIAICVEPDHNTEQIDCLHIAGNGACREIKGKAQILGYLRGFFHRPLRLATV